MDDENCKIAQFNNKAKACMERIVKRQAAGQACARRDIVKMKRYYAEIRQIIDRMIEQVAPIIPREPNPQPPREYICSCVVPRPRKRPKVAKRTIQTQTSEILQDDTVEAWIIDIDNGDDIELLEALHLCDDSEDSASISEVSANPECMSPNATETDADYEISIDEVEEEESETEDDNQVALEVELPVVSNDEAEESETDNDMQVVIQLEMPTE